MQNLTLNLDGSPGTLDVGPINLSPEESIYKAIEQSSTGPGYHSIWGENLDGSPTGKVANVIASQGILIFQNVLNPD